MSAQVSSRTHTIYIYIFFPRQNCPPSCFPHLITYPSNYYCTISPSFLRYVKTDANLAPYPGMIKIPASLFKKREGAKFVAAKMDYSKERKRVAAMGDDDDDDKENLRARALKQRKNFTEKAKNAPPPTEPFSSFHFYNLITQLIILTLRKSTTPTRW